MFQFENDGPWFHVPIRCDRMSLSGVDLCGYCVEREKKTIEKLRDIRGTTIGGTLPSYLMGRIIEPIPYWSRLYGGAWFNLKIQEGYTISGETMAKIQMKLDAAYGGVITVPPEPMPNGVTGKKGRRPKAAVAVAAPAPAVAAPAPVVALTVPAPAPKKRQAKKATATATAAATPSTPTAATAFVPNPETSEEVDDILTIPVRKTTVDGRDLYLDAAKDKLYDLKFKYLGRLKEGAIVAHPDSDAE